MSDLPPGRAPFGGVLLFLGMVCALGGALLLTALDTGGSWLAPAGGTGTESSPARGSGVPIGAITMLPAITRPAVSQHSPSGPTAPWPTAVSSDTPAPTAVSVFPATCQPPAGWVPVSVQTGDTLMLLAMRSLTTMEALRIANCLADTIIQPGQTIYVPAQPLPTPTVSPQCFPPYGWVFYVVRPGDTMFSIAARYGLTLSQLMFANCRSIYTVYVGETLYVPWVSPTATEVPTATPIPPTDTPVPPPDPTRTPRPPTPTATNTPPPASGTPTPTGTPVPPTPTGTSVPPTPTDTPVPPTPTGTSVPPTPTDTPAPPTPTDTPVPPTPTDTPVPPTPTDTPVPPTPTDTPVPPTP